MKNLFIKRYLLCILISIFSLSCAKDNSTSPNDNTSATPFTGLQEIENLIIYEVNPLALSETGNFQGVVNKLDHIKSLGVNVIWFMPVHPIGKINSVNSPYSVQNYKEVNPNYGTLDDFKALVNKAHTQDMAVIIDWVANHTAWDNPWINNKDWYTQNANGEIIIPAGTNWQDVADLNFDNQSMRLAMIDAMKFWVTDVSIDGFRCDAADFVPFDFWQQAIDSLKNITDHKLLFLAEGARDDHFEAGFDMNYGWDFYNKMKNIYNQNFSAQSIFTTNSDEYKSVPAGKQMLRFTTNHDESAWDATPVDLFGGLDGSLSAFVITTFLPGVPLIYGSQEVGTARTVSFFNHNPIDWSINPDLLGSYQKVLAFYNESQTARTGTLQTYNDRNIAAFTKTSDTDTVLVLVNTRNQSINYAIPQELQNGDWINVFGDSPLDLQNTLTFKPHQFFIAKK